MRTACCHGRIYEPVLCSGTEKYTEQGLAPGATVAPVLHSPHFIHGPTIEALVQTDGYNMTTSIQMELPEQLVAQAQTLVRDGWAADLDEILADALARYLESHNTELSEAFLRDDVQWGLHGKE